MQGHILHLPCEESNRRNSKFFSSFGGIRTQNTFIKSRSANHHARSLPVRGKLQAQGYLEKLYSTLLNVSQESEEVSRYREFRVKEVRLIEVSAEGWPSITDINCIKKKSKWRRLYRKLTRKAQVYYEDFLRVLELHRSAGIFDERDAFSDRYRSDGGVADNDG